MLLDLSLPDSGGLASLRELALTVLRLPIVVWTGLDNEAAPIEAMRHGAQDYLVKGRHDAALLGRSLRCACERKAFEAHLSELATAVAERILGRLQMPVSLSGEEIRVSSSIGIALFPDHATDGKTLLRHADTAMFRAKGLGRNNFQFYA